MNITDMQQYCGKTVKMVLKNNFYLKTTLPDKITSTVIEVKDVYGENMIIDIEYIALIMVKR